jgi:hypothetical protein
VRYTAVDGHTYITASQIRDETGYEDVTTALLRTWVDHSRLSVVTVAELAAALEQQLPAGVDGTAPARVPGRTGRENVYRWADIVRVETQTRQTRRARGGRARRPPRLALA